MVKLLRRALAKAKKEIAQVRKEARRNRLWMVVVKGDNLLLVPPAYYLDSKSEVDSEADQCKRGESPHRAGLRLQALLFKGMRTEVEYLGKYPLKGSMVPYEHLHVCLVFMSEEAPLPHPLADFMYPLDEIKKDVLDQNRTTGQVIADIREKLMWRPQNIIRELRKEGVV